MALRLRVEAPGTTAFTHELVAGEVIVGRGATAGLVLNDIGVSRLHARLTLRDREWWIEDLGATNRTELNGQLIQGATRINPGDRLRMGGTTLDVEGGAALPGLLAISLPEASDARQACV